MLKPLNHTLLKALPTIALMLTALPGQAIVAPPDATINGKSQAELSAEWWQYALGLPVDQNPILDTTGANAPIGQSGSVFFLVGSFGDATNRQITITNDKSLFFPLFNSVFISTPGDDFTEAELRDFVKQDVDTVTGLNASVDGVAVANLFNHRQFSPLFSVNLPDNNVFGAPPGVYAPAASDGYWLLASPLTVGKHTIAFGASNANGVVQDNTYEITVEAVPEPTTVLGLIIGGGLGMGARLRRRFSK